MTTPWKPPAPGALDDTPWPEQLIARAVERTSGEDRLHGYAVLGDIAAHYRFSDQIYLVITGELPDLERSALFHVAMCAAAVVWAGDASAHVAILARLSGSTLATALAAGMVAAAQEAETLVTEHAGLLAWLDDPAAPLPQAYAGSGDPWVATLIAACGNHRPETLRAGLTRSAAAIVIFHAAGLRGSDQITAALVVARGAGLPAEALLTGPEHLGAYPVKVPEFRYVEG